MIHHRRRSMLPSLIATLCFPGILAAQLHPLPTPGSPSIIVTAENGIPEIPFRLINNHLILPISVNGSKPLDVVLDTGMPAPGLALYSGPHTEKLGLSIDPTLATQVGGAGGAGASFPAKVAPKESLTLSGLEINEARIILMPPMPHFSGYHDGIIGYSLFEHFVVELDYDRRLMRLHDPKSYVAPPKAHVLSLDLHQRLPYATLRVTLHGQEPFDAKVVVDLGASHAISLNTNGSREIVVPEETLTAILGRGLSGPVKGKVGRIEALELAGLRLEDVVTSFPVQKHQNPRGVNSLAGNLGSDVLRRFKTTFDYPSRRMILEPSASFGEPFKFDRSGIRLGFGPELAVEGIIAGSPAEESGIQVGDLVTHLDGRIVSSKSYNEVREALIAAGQVRLTLRRGKLSLEKTITLRRLI